MNKLAIYCFLISILFVLTFDLSAQKADNQNTESDMFLKKIKATNNSDSILHYAHRALEANSKEVSKENYFEALHQLNLEFTYLNNPDSSSFYLNLMIQRLQEVVISSIARGHVYMHYGEAMSAKFEFEMALIYLDSAEHQYLSIGDSLYYADVLNQKAIVNDNMGRRSLAVEQYLKASSIYKRLQDDYMYFSMINNIAITYKKAGDFDTALEFYGKAIAASVQNNDSASIAIVKINRGLLYKDLKQFDLALSDIIWSKNYFESKRDTYSYNIALHNLGEVYLASGNVNEAQKYIEESQLTAAQFGYNALIVNNQHAFAKIAKANGDYKKSIDLALKAYDLAFDKLMLEQLLSLSALISANYEQVRDFERALIYHKQHIVYVDSIRDQKAQQQINMLKVQYQVEQKEEEIASLEMLSERQLALTDKERKLNLALILGVSFSLGLIILLFVLYTKQMGLLKKYREQKKKLNQLNQEKDQMVKMTAHDIRAPLNNIRGLLGLVKENQIDDKNDDLIGMAAESTEILRNRVDSMLDVNFINKGKINLLIENIDFENIVSKLNLVLQKSFDTKQVEFESCLSPGISCKGDDNYLLQVIENLCTNALKFSNPNTKVILSVKEEHGKCLIKVIDGGIGIREEEIKNLFKEEVKVSNEPTGGESSMGLGLVIVKKYVEAMNGEVWCESKIGEGSTFFVSLPLGSEFSS